MPMNFSPAGQALGLGGVGGFDLGIGLNLQNQTAEQAEDLRKKRLLELQQRQLLGPSGSPAAASLFGPALAGLGGGY